MPVLYNPRAGRARILANHLQRARIPRECLLVVGGDGTVHRLVNRGPVRSPLGLIPGGTANDLADELGVPREPARALAWLEKASPAAHDLVTINGIKIATSAGLGVPDRVVELADRWKRDRVISSLGRFVYMASTLRILAPSRVPVSRIVISHPGGDEVFRAHSVLVMNQARLGAYLRPVPGARPDDGKFDIVVFPESSGTRTLLSLASPSGLIHRQCRRASIETEVPVGLVADGERYPPNRRFEIGILEGALPVLKGAP